nr:MAG TPA_asm: hypothetical protein [Caudoviricetes sp.]
MRDPGLYTEILNKSVCLESKKLEYNTRNSLK